ncbi:beta-mannosidase [Nocardia sp. CC227C]|uniref:beta-mannosidase n=1 Tax=Nocardia sp. CC227C TaxID=3044562 RepID=UPI00278C3667|nr:beta-mannosidase [Nocardia sp. CC227C]
MSARVRVLAVLAALCLGAGCADGGPDAPDAVVPDGPPAAEAAVSAAASGLLLNGKPWWPAGFNAPQLATDYGVNLGCGAEVNLDEFFARLPRHSLTRFNVFQALAVNKTTGALDFRAVDAVFAAAERHAQLVLPVLVPQDGACDDETFKQREWFARGWTEVRPIEGRVVLSTRDWIRAAVQRWRGSPVVAGWEVIGEPEPGVCAGDCADDHRSCPDDAAAVLRTFMDESGALVRRLDPGRLVFAGFIGGGQCGTAGEEFLRVGASPFIDVLEFHDYGAEDIAVPGDAFDGLAVRLDQAELLGKPLLVAEIGVAAGSCRSLPARRDAVDRKMTGQRAAGAAGALVWAFVPDPRTDACTFDVGPDDPLWELMAERITAG